MVAWTLKFTKQVQSDSLKLKSINLKNKAQNLLNLLQEDPFRTPPRFEKLLGFKNVYSRRINIQHRMVYEVFKEEKIVKIISLWGHYNDN